MQQRSVFREGAMEKLMGLEDLEKLMRVNSPSAWLTLATAFVILLTFGVWAFLGDASRTAQGEGVLIREGGIQKIVSPVTGQVVRIASQSPAPLPPHAEVAVIRSPDGRETPVLAEQGGEILEITAREGMQVSQGEELARLERETPLIALLYIPVEEAKSVQAGMETRLLPAGMRPQEHGYLKGRVTSVSRYPTSSRRIALLLENEELARRLQRSGPVMEAQVALENSANAKGYQWTASEGPKAPLTSGTLCTALFTLSQEPPIRLAMPAKGEHP